MLEAEFGGRPVLGVELGTLIIGSRVSKTKTLYLRLDKYVGKSDVEVQRKHHPLFNTKSLRRQ